MGFYYTYLIVWSVFESVLCSAPIFGWAQLLEILQNERYFSSYCWHEANSNQTNTSHDVLQSEDITNKCSKQDSLLNMAFTVSIFVCFGSVFLSGKYMDMFGFRKTRILASFSFLLAGGAMYASTHGIDEMLFPGLFLTVIGGACYMSVLVKVCGILPRRSFTAVSVINGGFDSSGVMLLIWKLCYNAGISFQTIIIVYYSFVFVHGLLFTFTIFPEELSRKTEKEIVQLCANNEKILANKQLRNVEECDTEKEISKKNENGCRNTETESSGLITAEEYKTDKTAKLKRIHDDDGKTNLISIIKSGTFIIHTCFVSISSLRSVSFTGMINTWLKFIAENDETVDLYLTILGFIQFSAIFLAFLPGFLLDWSPAGRHWNFSCIISFTLTGLMSILLTVGFLIPVLELQIFNFVLYTLMRSFLYSTHSSFILKQFPLYHAGALLGLSLLISALLSLVQIPMFALMEGPYKGDPTWVNVGLLGFQILVMIHPIFLWKCSKNLEKSSENTLKIRDTKLDANDRHNNV